MRKLHASVLIAAVLFTLFCSSGSLQAQRGGGIERPLPGTVLGVAVSPVTSPVTGILVKEVGQGSLADKAGVKAGDIITTVNGRSVTCTKDVFAVLVTNARMRRGVNGVDLVVYRDGQSLTLHAGTSSSGQPEDSFGGIGKESAKTSLSDINVLKYAIINPQTRVITLIGKYDPKYKTGPIPYYDLLNDVMGSPYPYFSLEPTSQTQSSVAAAESAVDSDVARMQSDSAYTAEWGQRLLSMILNDPSLRVDRQRFIKKGAEAFQLTEGEMLKVFLKSANDSSVSQEEMIPIIIKLMRGLGCTKVADALGIMSSDVWGVFDILGLRPQAQDIVSKVNSGQMAKDQGAFQLTVLVESAMLKEAGVSGNQVDPKVSQAMSGSMSSQEWDAFWNDKLTGFVVDKAGLKMFNCLTLSGKVLAKLYNVSAPCMDLVFKDVPADTALGDVLFRADYALKSICTNPEVKERIPGFQNEIEYMYEAAEKRGVHIGGDCGAEAGHRLVPGDVKMRVSPSGTLVSFDDANVKIIGWLIKPVGKKCSPEVESQIRTGTEEYAASLTQRYEELAAVFPELHRLRETEKLIALSRWATSNNYKIVVDRVSGTKYSSPKTAVGFWQAVFTADPEHLSLTIIAEGGADFGKENGDAWIQTSPDSQATADISKQLVTSAVIARGAADAAIGGNLDLARDLADKSARAMTGDIDLTKLPPLDSIPAVGEPATEAVISTAAIDAVEKNLKAIENAKISMQKAADLGNTSPTEAAQLKAQAQEQQTQAEANLKGIRDAVDWLRNNPDKADQAAVTISSYGSKFTSPSTATATQPTTGSTVSGDQTPATPQPAEQKDITPEQRAKWIAELAKLQYELKATQDQFRKLNQSIQADQQQFQDWEKVADDGKNRCSGVLYNLLMDASAAQLGQRYETMHELAEKLPNKPLDLISRLGRIKNWFKTLTYTQAFKDVADIAARDGKTLPELLEEVRDDINIINSVTGLDKTTAGAAWKQFSNIEELSYMFAQFCAADDGIQQMNKNTEEYRRAVESLTKRMQTLVERVKVIKANLAQSEETGR